MSTNEFLALDQQIRLYHATSPYVSDWTDDAFDSTKNWHDSYLGVKTYDALISAHLRHMEDPGPQWLAKITHNAFSPNFKTGFIPFDGVWQAIKADHWNADYFSKQFGIHQKVFDQIYLNGAVVSVTDFAEVRAQVLAALASGHLVPASPVSLRCAEIERIERVLGSDWQFGVPFAYKNGDVGACGNDSEGGPGHPSNEGSHAELAPNGFPSLEGPKPDALSNSQPSTPKDKK